MNIKKLAKYICKMNSKRIAKSIPFKNTNEKLGIKRYTVIFIK